MSYKLVDVVFDIPITGNAKIVLAALCRHAHNDSSGAYPSVETIVDESGLSRSTVMRALNYLEGKQLIVAENKRRAGGRQTVRWRIGFYLVDECQIDTSVTCVDSDECHSDTPHVSQGHLSCVTLTPSCVTLTPESVSNSPASCVESAGCSTSPETESVSNQSGKRSINPSIVDGWTDRFYKTAGKSLGLADQHRAYIVKCLVAGLSVERLDKAFDKFLSDSHNWPSVTQPAQLFCKKLNEYVRQVKHDAANTPATSTPIEVDIAERARQLEALDLTEEEYDRIIVNGENEETVRGERRLKR
jgi:hypothetical protein